MTVSGGPGHESQTHSLAGRERHGRRGGFDRKSTARQEDSDFQDLARGIQTVQVAEIVRSEAVRYGPRDPPSPHRDAYQHMYLITVFVHIVSFGFQFVKNAFQNH